MKNSICSKSTIETLLKGVKYVQSQQNTYEQRLKLFCENSLWLLAINYFRKKAPYVVMESFLFTLNMFFSHFFPVLLLLTLNR